MPRFLAGRKRAYHGVYFVLRNGAFDWKPVPQSTARKFLANLVDGRLEPAVPIAGGDGDLSDFEVPGLPVWPAVQKFIDQSAAEGETAEDKDEPVRVKFIEIQDTSGNSVLNDIEYIAPEADGVTIILHRAERPRLFFMFGEKAQQRRLQRLANVVSSFKREYGRGAGKPPNMQDLENTLAAIDKGGALKDMTETPTPPNTTEKALARQAKRMSRARRDLRKPLPQP